MASQRRAGTIKLQTNGTVQDAKGNFSFNLGHPKRDAIVGADRIHGYKEVPQVPFIEGEITDRGDLNLKELVNTVDATVTLELANGKIIALNNAWFAGEGTGNTEEANLTVRFESSQPAEEVT